MRRDTVLFESRAEYPRRAASSSSPPSLPDFFAPRCDDLTTDGSRLEIPLSRRKKKMMRKFSISHCDAEDRRSRRCIGHLRRTNLESRRSKISRVIFAAFAFRLRFTYGSKLHAAAELVIARDSEWKRYTLQRASLTSLSRYGISNFNLFIENLFFLFLFLNENFKSRRA